MITLVLGGARSGKSRYAEALARKAAGKVVFIATAQACDDEMHAKIERHRQERPSTWLTVETPFDLEGAIASHGARGSFLIVDCLTTLTANLLLAESEDKDRVLARIESICATLATTAASVVLVSNEVGSSVVPEYALGRTFRDLLGELNQRVARIADNVILMVAGYPLAVKGSIEVPAEDIQPTELHSNAAAGNGVRQ